MSERDYRRLEIEKFEKEVAARYPKESSMPQEPLRVRKESLDAKLKEYERNQERAAKKELKKRNEKTPHHLIQLFLMSLSLTLALIMLNAPTWLICLATFIVFSPALICSLTYTAMLCCAYDILRPVLYIWALVVTVQGKQDFFAIAFYILAALQIFSIVKRFIGTIGIILIALTDRKN